uniref:Uncharacterized protein n=1 Tax=Ciona savignyi TaxID=51511 RepID=H2Y7W8_CIOSA
MRGYFVFVCALLCLATAVCGIQESCSISGSGVYSNGMVFTSLKDDGSTYSCRCGGYNCRRMSCTKRATAATTAPPTTTSDNDDDEDGDVIFGMVPGEPVVIEPVVEQPATNAPVVPQHQPVILLPGQPLHPYSGGEITPVRTEPCVDTESGRSFQRGSEFHRVRKDQARLLCKCPATGDPVIKCKNAPCEMAAAPAMPEGYTPSENFACYDVWNRQEHQHGSTFIRTRFIDPAKTISGRYRCTCSYGATRCSAIDMPCCDQETGQWKGMNEKFFVERSYLGTPAKCTCLMQRQRFDYCLPLQTASTNVGSVPIRGRYPTIQVPGQSVPGRYVPSRPQGQCYDSRYTHQYYQVGSSFDQDRGRLGIWHCNCMRQGNVYRLRCTSRM